MRGLLGTYGGDAAQPSTSKNGSRQVPVTFPTSVQFQTLLVRSRFVPAEVQVLLVHSVVQFVVLPKLSRPVCSLFFCNAKLRFSIPWITFPLPGFTFPTPRNA